MLQTVIVHPEKGIFLGLRGSPIFTKEDGFSGLKHATTFRSQQDAIAAAARLGFQPDDVDYRLVRVADMGSASFQELREAGLGSHLNKAIHQLLALASAA